jgi:hypothetical protein
MARGVCIGGGEARSLGFFHGQGGKVVERSAVSLHQNNGRNGGLVHGARGRKERRGRTQRCGHDVWRRGAGRRGARAGEEESESVGRPRGLGSESSAPFYLFKKNSN